MDCILVLITINALKVTVLLSTIHDPLFGLHWVGNKEQCVSGKDLQWVLNVYHRGVLGRISLYTVNCWPDRFFFPPSAV